MIKLDLGRKEESILDFHYRNLTVKVGRKKTVLDFLNHRIRKYQAQPRIKSLYEFLLSKTRRDADGFSILTARPHELDDFASSLKSTFGSLLTLERKDDLEKIFYYNSYDKWKPYKLAKIIDCPVCPYCNRSYTFIAGSDRAKGTRFQFDHFLPKSEYPYLALSFFNLVPSCNTCNSDLKRDTPFEYRMNVHPYDSGFKDEIEFTIKAKSVQFLNGKASEYSIGWKRAKEATWTMSECKAALRNIKTLRLTELYNLHKDFVDEIIQTSRAYDSSYIDSLFNKFKGTLFSNRDDALRMVTRNYHHPQDLNKRVLSKLSSDLSRELGIN